MVDVGAKSMLPPDDFVVGLVVMLVGGPVTVAVVDTDVARVGVSLQRSSWQQKPSQVCTLPPPELSEAVIFPQTCSWLWFSGVQTD